MMTTILVRCVPFFGSYAYRCTDFEQEEKRAMFAKYAVKPADQVAVEAQS